MSFFEPPPPPEEEPPERYRQPIWIGPPDNFLGVGVPLRLLLARTERAAVAITGCVAYPVGAVFELSLRLRPGSLSLEERRALMHGGPFHLHGPYAGDAWPPELLRLGVLFSDGRKVTSIDDRRAFHGGDAPPEGPILTPRGGGGGDHAWSAGFWLWPLPPAGVLTFVVEWPALGIPETRVECDGAPIVEAAGSAEPLWPDEDGSGSGGWVGYGMHGVSSLPTRGKPKDE